METIIVYAVMAAIFIVTFFVVRNYDEKKEKPSAKG